MKVTPLWRIRTIVSMVRAAQRAHREKYHSEMTFLETLWEMVNYSA